MGTPLQIEDQYVEIDGIRTRYIDEGEGPVILLLHGGHFGMWIPTGIDGWSRTIPSLAQNFRVVAFDKLGQGKTDLPASHSGWTFDAVVEHAKGFIRKLGLLGVTVVGHSRGGLLASKLALDLPEVMNGLCIVSSATLAGANPGVRDIAFYDDLEASVPQNATAAEVAYTYLRAQWVSAEVPQALIDSAAELYESPAHQKAMETYPLIEEKYWTPSLEAAKSEVRNRLLSGECNVPVEIIWGRDDRSAPVEMGFKFFESLARCSDRTGMHVLAGAGHHVFSERPTEFNDLVSTYAHRWS